MCCFLLLQFSRTQCNSGEKLLISTGMDSRYFRNEISANYNSTIYKDFASVPMGCRTVSHSKQEQ